MLVVRFPLVNVGEMNFDQRLFKQFCGVQHGNRAEGESCRINDDSALLFECLLEPIDHLSFMIGLAEVTLKVKVVRQSPATFLDVRQGCCSIEMRLAPAEHVQIGAIEDV